MGHLLGNGFTCTVMARVLVSAIEAEDESRAATGAPAATGASNRKYAYDTPLPNLKRPANGYIKSRPACLYGQLGTAPAHQKPPLKRPAPAHPESMVAISYYPLSSRPMASQAANGLTGGHNL